MDTAEKELQTKLFTLQDPAYKDFHTKLTPTMDPDNPQQGHFKAGSFPITHE